jgi:hypothetical protein
MEKFFERNPLQVFTVINMVVLGLSVIVLALMNFLGVYDINEIVIKAQLESFLGVIAILFIVFFLGNKADVSKLFLMELLFIFIIYLSLGYHLPI